jgi:hypothetical protein
VSLDSRRRAVVEHGHGSDTQAPAPQRGVAVLHRSTGGCAAVSQPLFVVVSGPPASGKSTVAPALARQLGLPLVAKDTIKDALVSVLPVPDVEASRQLGRGAVAAMLAVAAESPIGAVIESNLYRSVAVDSLGRLPGALVEVFLPLRPSGRAHPVSRPSWHSPRRALRRCPHRRGALEQRGRRAGRWRMASAGG